MLGDVGDRDHEQRAGDVHAPGVVPLHVGLLRRQVEPAVGELADLIAVRARPSARRATSSVAAVDERAGVAGGEEVDAGVVGEEQLARCGSRRPTGSVRPPARAGVVRTGAARSGALRVIK